MPVLSNHLWPFNFELMGKLGLVLVFIKLYVCTSC